MKKLIKIQSELKAPKGQFNAFGKYKYRNCEDVLEALKPLLTANECTLIISDEIKEAGSLIYVESTANFSDGTNIISVKAQAGIDPNRKGMDIAQSFGSSSSYARKYALNGLFLIDDTKDADATNDRKDEKKASIKAKDYTAEKDLLNSSVSLANLKANYSEIDREAQTALVGLKNELKANYSEIDREAQTALVGLKNELKSKLS